MSDFSPSTRNSAIWSGDSRKVANGRANEVILTKQGIIEIEDLSEIEAVQMGHVLEPVIGRLAQAKLGVELVKIEDALSHKKHDWFKSHFDFAGKKDGKTILVEAKNYNAATRSKFDISGICPPADMAQLVHEAAVFGVQTWMRGRSAKRTRKQSAKSGVLYYHLNMNGPEGSVLAWYTKLRNLAAIRRGSYTGVPHPREHQELSDDEELYPASETFEVAKLQLQPGSIAAPEVIAVSAADDCRLDAAQHPVEADLEKRYHEMWQNAMGQLEVL